MPWIYRALLWFLGLTEPITEILRRQKDRLGAWWWIMAVGTILLLVLLLFHVARWPFKFLASKLQARYGA